MVAALAYVKGREVDIVDKEFDAACGVGISVTDEEIKQLVATMLKEKDAELKERRYQMVAALLKATKEHARLKWAPGQIVAKAVEEGMLAVLGPKDERDDPKKKVRRP
jgi:glutaminyl-tRNA synthetase